MISLKCPCCDAAFMTATPAQDQDPIAFRLAWKAVAARTPVFTCGACDGTFTLIDDGAPSGTVGLNNVSKPRIDSLNVNGGPRTGGNAVFLAGQALDIGTLVVKFGGKNVTTIDQRTETSARVVVPPATYRLNIAARAHRFEVTPTYSTLQLGEAVTTTAGSSGTIRLIEGNIYWVVFGSVVESLEDMIGTHLVGSSSSAVATINVATWPMFQDAETITGLSSASQGVLRYVSGMILDSPAAAFTPNELIRGASTKTLAQLSGTEPYVGWVDVTVENEFGRRLTGGLLHNAYTYT